MSERAVFLEALRVGDAGLRLALIGERCGGDEALRRRVEALLRAHDAAGGFLDAPATRPRGDLELPAGGPLDFLEPPGRPGALGRLGPYEVLEILGRGRPAWS